VDDNRFSTSAFCHDLLHPITLPGSPEGVDAAKRALYKTLNGGGRNPAAAVL
jgi:hypothetical protein